MNYYEQFYDDLEFCDPLDDPYNRDPYYQHDPNYRAEHNYHDDPFYCDDPYYRVDPRYYRGYEGDPYDRQHRHERFPEDRQVPFGRGNSRGHQNDRSHSRGHRPPRGHVRSDRGRRNWASCEERGGGSGRGKTLQGNQRGRLKTMNFVKASTSSIASSSSSSFGKQENGENKGESRSEQIRFDYKSYQNQPSESEKEEEQALKAYSCHLGFGYGYGPRTDLIEGDQPEWLIRQEEVCKPEGNDEVSEYATEMETESAEKQEAESNIKKAMVSPAFNFVKAKSEFHSIDVAFHEKEEEKPKPNSLSVNFGNKRVGLGFGVSANKATAPSVDITDTYYAGVRDGCNPHIDARFCRLQGAVKERSLPNKNAIEILHMAVDKVKMVISDEITASNRTPTGQPMFLCRLMIDGVSIAQGQATNKKAAKHEAYKNALKVFTYPTLTVKEISQGVFELRQKDVEFKVPNPVGLPVAKSGVQHGVCTQNAHGQKNQTGTNTVGSAAKSVSQSACVSERNTAGTTSQVSQSVCSKPKIVFHQPAHPLSNKPLEFKNDSLQTSTQTHYPLNRKPEELAMKLLNFVKAGEKTENQSETDNASTSSSFGNFSQNTSGTQNQKKRSLGQSQKLDSGKLKIQKKGGNVNHSIEDLSQFILIDSTPLNQTANEMAILHNSANFNRVVLKLEYENIPDGVRCSLVLSDIIVAISQGATKEDARHQVACDALNYLQECCYTIKIKQAVDSDSSGLTKEQLLSDIHRAGEEGGGGVIPDTNIGNMLLRKMGWVGGGCGKDGTGIAEPVKAEMIIGREGLGLKTEKGIGRNFHQRVAKMLQDYIRSDEQKDLHFSSELSKEERAIIHNIGQKLGLKTHSRGKDENRYLIISRKRSAQQLLAHVRESGGSTSKYELIPPGDPDLDLFRREDISHGHCKQ